MRVPWDIRGSAWPLLVMSPPALLLFQLFVGAEVAPDVLHFLLERQLFLALSTPASHLLSEHSLVVLDFFGQLLGVGLRTIGVAGDVVRDIPSPNRVGVAFSLRVLWAQLRQRSLGH